MAVEVHQVVRDLAGNVLKDHVVRHVYAFEDGLIRSMEIREANQAAREHARLLTPPADAPATILEASLFLTAHGSVMLHVPKDTKGPQGAPTAASRDCSDGPAAVWRLKLSRRKNLVTTLSTLVLRRLRATWPLNQSLAVPLGEDYLSRRCARGAGC